MALNRNQLSPLTPVSIRQNAIPEVQAGQGFGLLSGIYDPIGNGQWQYGADMQQPMPDPIGSGQWQYGQGAQPQQSAGYRGESPEMTAMYERWINGQKSPMDGVGNKVLGMLDNPEALSQLALGFNSMRLQPDQALAAQLGSEIKYAREQKSKNKTLEALGEMGTLGEGEKKLLSENPELMKVVFTAMYKKRLGLDSTAEMQTFEAMTKGLTPEDRAKAARIKLGLDPRAAQSLSIPLERLFGEGFSKKSGEEAAKAEAEVVAKKALNNGLRVQMNFALDNLGNALGGTGQTGQIFGNIPAITTAAQIADNAKALVLPIMKGVWRGAGEGVFTDKDQETLEAMFPTRSMTPEAAKQALLMVKRLTELKLQDPTFDINAYGGALKLRGQQTVAPVSASVPSNTPQPATAQQNTAGSIRSQADKIIGD